MNNNFFTLATLCLLSIQSYAEGYAGINLGINTLSTKKELSYPLYNTSLSTAHHQENNTNFHGQFTLGYTFFSRNKFALSLEGNGDLFTGKTQTSIQNWFFSENLIAEEQLKYGGGLFLLPSYTINKQTQFFIGPGLVGSKFKVSSKNTAGNLGVSGSFEKGLVGAGFKAGINTTLMQTLDLNISYQYSAYQHVTWINKEPLTQEFLKADYQPLVNTVLIGLRKILNF